MTIPQTSVAADLVQAVEGQVIVSPYGGLMSVVDPDNDLPFGRAVQWDTGTNPEEVKPPVAGGVLAGIAVFSHAFANRELTGGNGIPKKTPFNILRKGQIWVVAENAVDPTKGVYYRHANAGAAPEKVGRFRSDADATAQVVTATPTAANSIEYQLQIHFTKGPAKGETHVIQFVSDASGTDTEICDGMRASLNANARLAALITESGTTTLVLTATDAESAFEVDDIGAGDWASITETTAQAQDATKVPNARWLTTTTGTGKLAKLEISLVD